MAALPKECIETLIKQKSERITFKEEEQGKSKVWKGFQRVFVDREKQDFVACNNCATLLTHSKTTGTSGLTKHKCVSVGVNSDQRKINSIFAPKQMDSKLKTKIIKAAVLFAAKDLRPFTILDGDGFRLMAQELIAIGSKS
ncbi:transposable element Hobo transposase-like protein, partial [Leptotrombidium deliense]